MLAILPIMALCSMLLPPYYAQNYAGLIGSSLHHTYLKPGNTMWQGAHMEGKTLKIFTGPVTAAKVNTNVCLQISAVNLRS